MSTVIAAAAAHPAVLAAAQGWHGGPPFFLFPLFFIAFWVIMAFVFVGLRRGGWRARNDARAVLADRFARGEIEVDEYRARLSELSRK
jgi:putative membrane protein